MTKDLLTDLGEEYFVKNGLDAITVDVGVYLDSSDYDDDGTVEGDKLDEGSDVGDITTEPTNDNYAQASVTFSADDFSGDWGVDNDSKFTFDFSDTTGDSWIDCAFVTYSFQADDTGDSSSQTHLISNPALSQARHIGSIDTLEIAAGDLKITLD